WAEEAATTKPTSPFVATNGRRAAWQYPALSWLADVAARTPASTMLILAFMPPHVAGLPPAGSFRAARELECTARIAKIANRAGAHLVDFRIASSITREDNNYWDVLHYRLPIANRIVEDLGKAIAQQRDDPGGDWRYRAGPRKSAN